MIKIWALPAHAQSESEIAELSVLFGNVVLSSDGRFFVTANWNRAELWQLDLDDVRRFVGTQVRGCLSVDERTRSLGETIELAESNLTRCRFLMASALFQERGETEKEAPCEEHN